MRNAMTLGVCLLTISGALSAAAPSAEKDSKKDPNRMICEKQEELGSRLSTKRVCRTAAEWEAIRHEARQNLERAQTNRGTADGR